MNAQGNLGMKVEGVCSIKTIPFGEESMELSMCEIVFSSFLSIYSWCGALTSWLHDTSTTCLDIAGCLKYTVHM